MPRTIAEIETVQLTEEHNQIAAPTTPETDLLDREEIEQLWLLLRKLKPRHQLVLMMRYGLAGLNPQIRRHIGEKFRVTGQMAAVNEFAALRKLRARLGIARVVDAQKVA